MYVFCFQTCFAAYKPTRISAKAHLFLHLPKGFLKGRTVQCKYVALFLLFLISKMKNRSRAQHLRAPSIHWSVFSGCRKQRNLVYPLSLQQRLFRGWSMSLLGIRRKCRKSCALALYVCAYATKHVENKIHTCYEIKQLNVKTCFCVFKV